MDTTAHLSKVTQTTQAYEQVKRQAESMLTAAREARDQAIREASAASCRQVDIARASGLTRESVRVIVDPTKSPRARAAQK